MLDLTNPNCLTRSLCLGVRSWEMLIPLYFKSAHYNSLTLLRIFLFSSSCLTFSKQWSDVILIYIAQPVHCSASPLFTAMPRPSSQISWRKAISPAFVSSASSDWISGARYKMTLSFLRSISHFFSVSNTTCPLTAPHFPLFLPTLQYFYQVRSFTSSTLFICFILSSSSCRYSYCYDKIAISKQLSRHIITCDALLTILREQRCSAYCT